MRNTLTIENAKIAFRNFSGKEGKFNPAGRRNFCLFLDDDLALKMEQDGWNIKTLVPKNDGDEPQKYVQVTVAFGKIPPKIVLITHSGKTMLDQDTVNILDWAEIENVDLIINPSEWNVNGKTGIKAYLKSMYITIVEDELEEKYSNVPDSAKNTIIE